MSRRKRNTSRLPGYYRSRRRGCIVLIEMIRKHRKDHGGTIPSKTSQVNKYLNRWCKCNGRNGEMNTCPMVQNCNRKLPGEIDIRLNSNLRLKRSILTTQLLPTSQPAPLLVGPLHTEVEDSAWNHINHLPECHRNLLDLCVFFLRHRILLSSA